MHLFLPINFTESNIKPSDLRNCESNLYINGSPSYVLQFRVDEIKAITNNPEQKKTML